MNQTVSPPRRRPPHPAGAAEELIAAENRAACIDRAETIRALDLLRDLGGAAYIGDRTDRAGRTIAMRHASALEVERHVEIVGTRNARLSVILRGER